MFGRPKDCIAWRIRWDVNSHGHGHTLPDVVWHRPVSDLHVDEEQVCNGGPWHGMTSSLGNAHPRLRLDEREVHSGRDDQELMLAQITRPGCFRSHFGSSRARNTTQLLHRWRMVVKFERSQCTSRRRIDVSVSHELRLSWVFLGSFLDLGERCNSICRVATRMQVEAIPTIHFAALASMPKLTSYARNPGRRGGGGGIFGRGLLRSKTRRKPEGGSRSKRASEEEAKWWGLFSRLGGPGVGQWSALFGVD